jgi:hypothetical protein
MELGRVQRAVISRAAMAVLAGGLLFGGYKSLSVARWMHDDYEQHNPRADRSSGAGPFMVVAVVLLVLGGVLGLATVTPTAVFEKIMGPPRGTTLWDNSEVDGPGWRWWV